MVILFLANGFEEVEAITPLDMLRRVGVAVKTVGIGSKTIFGAHGIEVVADWEESQLNLQEVSGVILPGGMPGTKHLEASETVQKTLQYCMEQHLPVGAICAAPSILGHKGYLQGKKATCFPGFEKECLGAIMQSNPVVVDGKIITAKGAGCALLFGEALVACYTNQATANQLIKDLQVK